MSADMTDMEARAEMELRRMDDLAKSRVPPRPERIAVWASLVREFLARDDLWRGPIPDVERTAPLVLYFGTAADRDEFVQLFKDKAGADLRTRKL